MSKDKSKKEKTQSNDSLQQRVDDYREQIEKLEAKMDELVREKDELNGKFQRISADYANYQKRAPRQIADSVQYEKRSIFRSLLPSLDTFEHALASGNSAQDSEQILKGVRMIFEHMLDALKAHGITQISAAGEPFDPSRHEAMMQRNETDKPDGVVLEEFQKGYMLNEEVLRPAKVIVNKNPDQPAEQTENSDPSHDVEVQEVDSFEENDNQNENEKQNPEK